jgi:anthranilate synthase/indole-3-glycerol phosphate synthase/phosphoribosylanthranilate isomerase
MRVEDIAAAKEAGADFVGLMFAPDSRRRISLETAAALVEAAGPPLRDLGQSTPPPHHEAIVDATEWFAEGAKALERLLARKRPLTVGVFENQAIEEVNEIADEVGLDLIQLSGQETWQDCLLANRQVIKTIEASTGDAESALAALEPGMAIACLLDPSRGRGVATDRALASALAARVPLWLAGGLDPENAAAVVREVRPWAVDVSSGVETDGAKDAEKVRAFVEAARVAISLERSA